MFSLFSQQKQRIGKWLTLAKEKSSSWNSFETWRQGRRDYSTPIEEQFQTYLADLEKRLEHNPLIVDVRRPTEYTDRILKWLAQRDRFGFVVQHEIRLRLALENKRLAKLSIHGAFDLQLTDCVCHSIEIHGRDTPNIKLINCHVGTLEIHKEARAIVSLKKSYVEIFKMNTSSLKTLHVIRTKLIGLECPLPGSPSPFSGTAYFYKVSLSPSFQNRQPYRNLKHHLTQMHNLEAAETFHTAEMRSLVRDLTLTDKIISIIYQAISNYGSSTLRPLLWFLLFAATNVAFIHVTDTATVLNHPSLQDTWRAELIGDSLYPRLFRSTVLTFSQVMNPLGLFGVSNIVAAKTGYAAAASGTICLCATSSLALFFLSVRRKFKFSASNP